MAAEARRVGSAAGLDDAAGRRDGEAAEGDARPLPPSWTLEAGLSVLLLYRV